MTTAMPPRDREKNPDRPETGDPKRHEPEVEEPQDPHPDSRPENEPLRDPGRSPPDSLPPRRRENDPNVS